MAAYDHDVLMRRMLLSCNKHPQVQPARVAADQTGTLSDQDAWLALADLVNQNRNAGQGSAQ